MIDKVTVKFLLVGIINTLVGTSVMFVFYNVFHFGYWLSSASNYIIGSIVSFVLNKYFTFQNRERSFGQVMKFALNIAVCYILAYGLAKPCVHFILKNFSSDIRDNMAMFAGMCLFVLLNYFGQRFLVFKKEI